MSPEPFVKKYGKRHRELIEKLVPVLVASRPELDAHGVDAVLAAAVPKLKLPLHEDEQRDPGAGDRHHGACQLPVRRSSSWHSSSRVWRSPSKKRRA